MTRDITTAEIAAHRVERQKKDAPTPTYHTCYIDGTGKRHRWQGGTATLEESRWRIEHSAGGGGWSDWEKTKPAISERFRPVEATVERVEWRVAGDRIVPTFEPRRVWVWIKGKGWLSRAEVQAEIDVEDVPADHPGWLAGNWPE